MVKLARVGKSELTGNSMRFVVILVPMLMVVLIGSNFEVVGLGSLVLGFGLAVVVSAS